MNTQRPSPSREVRFEVENNFEGLKCGTRLVREQLNAWHMGERATYIAELALDELLTNIIRYAYSDEHVHLIGIGLRHDGNMVTLSLDDDGQPFDPISAEPLTQANQIEEARIGGRGLIMIRKMAHALRYTYHEGRNRLFVDIKADA